MQIFKGHDLRLAPLMLNTELASVVTRITEILFIDVHSLNVFVCLQFFTSALKSGVSNLLLISRLHVHLDVGLAN